LRAVIPGFDGLTLEQRRRACFVVLLFAEWLPVCQSNGYRYETVPIEKSISSKKRALNKDTAQGAAMGGRTLHTVRAISGGAKRDSVTYLGEEVWHDNSYGSWVHEFAHLAHYAMEKAKDSPSKRLVADIRAIYKRAIMSRTAPNGYAAQNHYEFFAEVLRFSIRRDPMSREVQQIAVAVIARSQLPPDVKEHLLSI
jgi:hypothetical protein